MPDNQSLTELDLDAIEVRANAATPGPWHEQHIGTDTCVSIGDYGWVVSGVRAPEYDVDSEQGRDDAEFIAHARADVSALLAKVRWLRAELADAEAMRDQAAQRAEELEANDTAGQLRDARRQVETWRSRALAAGYPDPGQEAATLRQAAESTNCLDDSELLTAMADERTIAPTTWAIPPEPTEHGTEVWDRRGERYRLDRETGTWQRWIAKHEMWAQTDLDWVDLLVPRGPLSAKPPEPAGGGQA